MVLVPSNQSCSNIQDSDIARIQQMLDTRKRKISQQFYDATGRKMCALVLPKTKKDKNV